MHSTPEMESFWPAFDFIYDDHNKFDYAASAAFWKAHEIIDKEITRMLRVLNSNVLKSQGRFFSAKYLSKADESSDALVWSMTNENGSYQYRLLSGADAPICVFRSQQRPDLKLAIELVGDEESVELALASCTRELFRH